MAAQKVIKINDSMKLLVFGSGIKLDVCSSIIYNPSFCYAHDEILLIGMEDSLKAAYEQGRIDAKHEIKCAYDKFTNKFKGY